MYAFLYDLQTYNNFKPALLSCLIKCFFFLLHVCLGVQKNYTSCGGTLVRLVSNILEKVRF